MNWSDLRFYCVNDKRQSAPVSDWTSNALHLQRELQADLPLNQLTVLGGHNAFNNTNDSYGIELSDLVSTTNQIELRALGKCMDDSSGSATTGASVKLWDCHGGSNQQWSQVWH